jgi:predicted metal-binding transcription factor (methanogenesis marker protein 9)
MSANPPSITLSNNSLPTRNVVLEQRGRGSKKYTAWTGQWSASGETTLSEVEIHEYTLKALQELEVAEETARRAQDRADALRMFARELYGEPSLSVVNDENLS